MQTKTNPTQIKGGLVADFNGEVCAFWMKYAALGEKTAVSQAGLPIVYVKKVIDTLRKGETPRFLRLPVTLGRIQLSMARALGLTEMRAREVERKVLIRVKATFHDDTSADKPFLKQNDIILSMQSQATLRFSDINTLLEESAMKGETEWTVDILRDGQEMSLTIALTSLPFPMVATKLVGWAGMILHDASGWNRAIEQVENIPPGPFIGSVLYGSPGDKTTNLIGTWVTEINGKPVKDLATFWRMVQSIDAKERHMRYHLPKVSNPLFWDVQSYIRLKTVSMFGRTQVLSLRTDEHYWPTFGINMDQAGVHYLHAKCSIKETVDNCKN